MNSMMMMTRWGELPMDPDTEPGIAAIEREQITKPRPMELEGPLLHQPVKIEQLSSYDAPIECTFGDALVTHTIALNQHAKKVRAMLASLQQQMENPHKQSETEDSMSFFPTIPVVECSEKETLRTRVTLDGCFTSKFRQGIGEALPEINEHLAKKMLRKALAVTCAHAGFDTTTESVLEILVDVVNEFFLKFTHLLRAAVDHEALVQGTNFPDVLEQVFYEIGIGSMRNLVTFYQTRVLNYHDHLLETCKQLNAEYKKLKYPDAAREPEENSVKVHEDEVPTILFPVTEEHDETHPPEASLHLDELQNLPTTFEQDTSHVGTEEEGTKSDQTVRTELLLSLPATNMPNLDPDEEIVNVIDSPGHATHATQEIEIINERQL